MRAWRSGRGIAERLGCEGAKVIEDCVGDPEGAEKTERAIDKVGGNREIVLADATSMEDDRRLVDIV